MTPLTSIYGYHNNADESWGQVFDSIITFLAYRRLSREVH